MNVLQPPVAISTLSNTASCENTSRNLPFYRSLGRTGLQVSCLGLGGGGGISSADVLYAFEQGINFFFFSSDLHHDSYRQMSDALRQLCGRGSSVREQIVLATVTYVLKPEMAMAALFDQFSELGIDYVDIFFWGWVGAEDRVAFHNCMQAAKRMRGANTLYQQKLERMFGVSERLKRMGAVRFIGASFHDLALAEQWINTPQLDVAMVRHNPVYRSAQTKVFNRLSSSHSQRPGILTFKSVGLHTGPRLWDIPNDLPVTCWKPSVPDLYRYSLSQSSVDVCLTGLTQREEIDAAIAGVKGGKLTTAEIEYLNIYGDLLSRKLRVREVSPERLVHK
jgi:predicted aldo/keto reductase-like oxidoreductase